MMQQRPGTIEFGNIPDAERARRKRELGRDLRRLRQQAIDAGMPLLTEAQLDEWLEERRRGNDPDLP